MDGNQNVDGDPNVDGMMGPSFVEGPSPEAAVAAIEGALDGGRVVSLVGACLVETGARDPDETGEPLPGDRRLVLLKPDGAVVIHGCSGPSPHHRQAATDALDVSARGDRLLIEARTGSATTRIECSEIELLSTFVLDGGEDDEGANDVGRRRHRAVRERLLAEPDLLEDGFRPLSTERETAAGPVDLYGRDGEGRSVVVEIKAHRAGPAAVGQLDRYVSALRRELHADATVRGVLVAPSVTERTRDLLADRGFSFRALPPDV